MYQLPSGGFPPQIIRPRASAVPRFGIVILIWVLLATGYAGYRLLVPPKHTVAEQTNPPPKPSVAPYAVAAWRAQAGNVNSATVRAETEIRQAEAEIRHTLTLTDS